MLQISRDEKMPAESTIRSWEVEGAINPKSKYAQFSANFARARDIGWEHYADYALEHAINPSVTKKVTIEDGPKGKRVTTVIEDTTDRDRLRVDTIKWLLARRLPKRYGDRIQIEAGKVGESDSMKELRDMAIDHYRTSGKPGDGKA